MVDFIFAVVAERDGELMLDGAFRICIGSQSFYPFAGGVSYYLYYLTRELLKYGVDVTAVHLGKPPIPSFEVIEGIKVYRVGFNKAAEWEKYAFFKENLYEQIHGLRTEGEWSWEGFDAFQSFSKLVASKIDELHELEPFNVINVHDWQVFFVPDFLQADVPLIYTWHVPFTEKMGEKMGLMVAKRLSKCDAVVFSTQTYVKHAERLGVPRRKIKCIHPFVDVDRFNIPNSEGEKFKEELGIPADGEVVLCVARIDPVKSHDDLLKAFTIVKEARRWANLVCVGNGSLSENVLGIRDERKEKIFNLVEELGLKEDVIFTGYLPPELLPKAYKMADVVVLPSKMEGFGLAITEAMASGRPVVAYNVGGVSVQIEDGVNGFLVPPGDIEAFADRIIRLLSNKALRSRMGLAARRIAEEKFNAKIAVKKYLNIFKEAMERRR